MQVSEQEGLYLAANIRLFLASGVVPIFHQGKPIKALERGYIGLLMPFWGWGANLGALLCLLLYREVLIFVCEFRLTY